MKQSYFILILWLCCMLAGCKGKNHDIVITGQLEGVEDSTTIRLMKVEGRMFVDLQTDTVIGGKFRFLLSDSVREPRQLALMANGEGFPPAWLDIWVRPGADIRITGKDKMLRTWDVSSQVPEQIELNTYNAQTEEYQRLSQSIMKDAYAYFDQMMVAAPEKRKEFAAKVDSLYALNDSVSLLTWKAEVDLMDRNKTYSPVWMGKLIRYAASLRYMKVSDAYVEKLKNMYEGMSDELKKSPDGETIHINLYPPSVVKDGDDMADADLWNLEGTLCHLADYKGKYLLLDFWSAGCGPCIMAMPEMKEISETYKDNLVVVSISSDTKEVWEKISREKDITWVNLNDFKGENGIKLHYGVTGIPHYVMISPEGKVITSWMGYGEGLLKSKIRDIVDKLD